MRKERVLALSERKAIWAEAGRGRGMARYAGKDAACSLMGRGTSVLPCALRKRDGAESHSGMPIAQVKLG